MFYRLRKLKKNSNKEISLYILLASSHALRACSVALPIFWEKCIVLYFFFSIDIKCSPLFLFFSIKIVILNNIIIHNKLFLILKFCSFFFFFNICKKTIHPKYIRFTNTGFISLLLQH